MGVMTKILPANQQSISAAAQTILSGGLVAFPTETVYGLGANALDAAAVEKIFSAKGRPSADPLIVHISGLDQINRVVRTLSPLAKTLAEAFWPGPLTLILPKHSSVPGLVTSGLENVAVRIPNHPVALALIQASGTPIAAPSANRFGHTSPTTARHVFQDLDGFVDIILDGGPTSIGVESTVLDLSTSPARILRPGGVTREMLESLIGPVTLFENLKRKYKGLPSPGMLKKHYAPRAEMILFKGEQAGDLLADYVTKQTTMGKRTGALVATEEAAGLERLGTVVFRLGPQADLAGIARRIYAGMRWLDDQKVDVIVCRDFGEGGLGLAIRDRLSRAATKVIG
jgi:L-threonylcarbamoyladenylate synthase